jgi:hypothetical protein
VAEITGIEYECVPDFYGMHGLYGMTAWDHLHKWLLEEEGFTAVLVDIDMKDDKSTTPYIARDYTCLGIVGNDESSHCVIVRVSDDGIEICGDPLDNSPYTAWDLWKLVLVFDGKILG